MTFYTLLAFCGLLGHAVAHSWNEQLAVIGPNGTFVGGYGYPRGYMARTEPGYNGYSMDWLLPPLTSGRLRIDNTDLLCHPSQRTHNQTAGYPRLQVAPGTPIAMKYLENGHVTLPQNQPGKPPKAGTVFVFGTMQPIEKETLAGVLQWNAQGTGGDKRGFLLGVNNFDDGRCHQINSGPISMQRQQEFPDPYPGQPGSKNELWCETNIVLPTDKSRVKPGTTLTVYWVWQWPTIPGAPGIPYGKDEYYTTCSDFDVVDTAPSGPISNTLVQQDPETVAVSDYLSRTAITTTPNVKFAEQTSWSMAHWASAAAATPAPVSHNAAYATSYKTTTSTQTPPATTPSSSSSTASLVPMSEVSGPAATGVTTAGAAVGTVYTALVTVTATLTPGQTAMVVQGTHVVTFLAPGATGVARRSVSDEDDDLAPVRPHPRRRARR